MVTDLADRVPNEISLTGHGLREDAFVISLFFAINTGTIAARNAPAASTSPQLTVQQLGNIRSYEITRAEHIDNQKSHKPD